MKKLKMFIPFCVLVIGLMLTSSAQSSTYTFSPIPADLNDLDHSYYYEWGIKWDLPNNEIITGAVIKYYDIYNWFSESNDRLYTNLLNSVFDTSAPDSSIYKLINKGDYSYWTYTKRRPDSQSNGNAFSDPTNAYNIVPYPGYWTDPDDNVSSTPLSYSIPSDHYSWISDGNFGFGIDPDCHYYNTKIEFEIITTTTPVPEPASMLLLGSGLIGLAGFARKKFKK